MIHVGLRDFDNANQFLFPLAGTELLIKLGPHEFFAVNSDKTWNISCWYALKRPVPVGPGEWPREDEVGAYRDREGTFQLVTKISTKVRLEMAADAPGRGDREQRGLDYRPRGDRTSAAICKKLLATAQGKQLQNCLKLDFYGPDLFQAATPLNALRVDVPDRPNHVNELNCSCCFALSLNHMIGGHTFHSFEDALVLMRKVTNEPMFVQLVNLVVKRGVSIPLDRPVLPYKQRPESPLEWLGFEKITINRPEEIVHLSHNPIAFNNLLTKLSPERCLVAVQRSPCTSVDSQHTGHVFTLKIAQESNQWIFRDNILGFTPTIEFGADGLSKTTSKHFSTMLNRATRIEVYYFKGVNGRMLTQQQVNPDKLAKQDPTLDLRSILQPPQGRRRKPAESAQSHFTRVSSPSEVVELFNKDIAAEQARMQEEERAEHLARNSMQELPR